MLVLSVLPWHQPFLLPLLILPVLAFVAEFLPVEISRGVRLTFPLPFLAAMAVAAGGPLPAALTDLGVTLAAALAIGFHKKLAIDVRWLVANLCVTAISAGVGGLGYWLTFDLAGTLPAALMFCMMYALTNYVLVSQLHKVSVGRALNEDLLPALFALAQSLLIYAMLGVATAVLVEKGQVLLVPLVLLPVLVMRMLFVMKARMYEQYYETISALTVMLQRAHPYTHGHLERVARVSELVALKLGLPRHRARLIREASVLHDIGKIAIDETILDKPAKLTEAEMNHVRKHSLFGSQILAPVAPFREMVPWIKYHHERPDGRGYPEGLHDVEIPIESKIIAVVDAYDAMTGGDHPADKRSYKEPITQEAALAELERCSGTQFDTTVVAAFREVMLTEARY